MNMNDDPANTPSFYSGNTATNADGSPWYVTCISNTPTGDGKMWIHGDSCRGTNGPTGNCTTYFWGIMCGERSNGGGGHHHHL
jgi:hypothetical protein